MFTNQENFSIDQQEIWLPVVDYEGLYEVSSMGRVKSLNYNRTGTERVLRLARDSKGYLQVALFKDGKMKRHLVHRLVAQAFLDNPLNLPQVNHLDENPLNNRASNLEFCDAKYNSNYGTRNAKVAKAHLNHPSLSKPVLQYTVDGELVREWPSVMEAERQGGYNQGNISHCCSGRHKTHGGYVWKYKEQP